MNIQTRLLTLAALCSCLLTKQMAMAQDQGTATPTTATPTTATPTTATPTTATPTTATPTTATPTTATPTTATPTDGKDGDISMLAQIKQLNNRDSSKVGEILSGLSTEFSQAQEELLKQLESSRNETQCAAAYSLGLYRSKRAIPRLAEKIALKDERFPRQQTREWFWDRYPAAEALTRIGFDAVPALITNLSTSDDAEVRDLSLRVIKDAAGPDVAQFLIERAANDETDATNKARLNAVLQSLKATK